MSGKDTPKMPGSLSPDKPQPNSLSEEKEGAGGGGKVQRNGEGAGGGGKAQENGDQLGGAAKLIRKFVTTYWWYGLIVTVVFSVIGVSLAFSSRQPNFFFEAFGCSNIKLHQFVGELIAISSVTIAVITTGLAVASTIYVLLWQAITDSLFRAIVDMHKNNMIDDSIKESALKNASIKWEATKEEIRKAKTHFKLILVLLIGIVITLVTIFLLTLYAGMNKNILVESALLMSSIIVLLISLLLILLFFRTILKIQTAGPVRATFELQNTMLAQLMPRLFDQE